MLQTLTFSPSNSFNFSPGKSSVVAGALGSVGKPLISGANIRRLSARCVTAEAAPAPAIEMSLYDVLRVNKGASSREIKTAYRTLAKIYHPDAVASAAARLQESSSDGRLFLEIHHAYATLSDPTARSLYDLELSVGANGRARNNWNGIHACTTGTHPTRRWETDQCW
ncbi:PREDICTED: chaperone protein dnaJ 11, chloroplastic-like [Ipomoea nil]|uniref:chaperone protein dnaJ 11, chloroplastic-like n=1 Tax=Ipomoea nil TaxID=35883 RepID=UPI000901E916|nr:PREDICTED: chaperone protein dnaJ 11, chloroplastic-like [Ipomoea nil]